MCMTVVLGVGVRVRTVAGTSSNAWKNLLTQFCVSFVDRSTGSTQHRIDDLICNETPRLDWLPVQGNA